MRRHGDALAHGHVGDGRLRPLSPRHHAADLTGEVDAGGPAEAEARRSSLSSRSLPSFLPIFTAPTLLDYARMSLTGMGSVPRAFGLVDRRGRRRASVGGRVNLVLGLTSPSGERAGDGDQP